MPVEDELAQLEHLQELQRTGQLSRPSRPKTAPRKKAVHAAVNAAYRAKKAEILRRYHKERYDTAAYFKREFAGLYSNLERRLISAQVYKRGYKKLEHDQRVMFNDIAARQRQALAQLEAGLG